MLRTINSNGSALMFGNRDNPQPNKHEPVITLRVSLLEASPIILIGNISLNHLKLSTVLSSIIPIDKLISATSSIYRPIESFPSGDKIPGFWYKASNKANKDTNRTIVNIVMINRLGKFSFDFLLFEIVRIEWVDKTTADRTKGIAGKDISWISDNPNELKLSEASGNIKPSNNDIGKI